MKIKIFKNGLVVKYRRSAIILENYNGKQENESRFDFHFTTEGFVEFVEFIKKAANESWKNVVPKEVNSMGTDYNEYYDRKYDNNGYLYITDTGLQIESPHLSKDTLYQFNKAKIQSFIFDLDKVINEKGNAE